FPVEAEFESLQVINSSSQTQSFWISTAQSPESQRTELGFVVPGHEKLEIPLVNLPDADWLRVMAENKQTLRLVLKSPQISETALTSGSSSFWKVRAKPQSELIIFNQAPFPQSIQISAPLMKTRKVHLDAFGKTRILSSSLIKNSWIRI